MWTEIKFAAFSVIPVLFCAWQFNNLVFLKTGLIAMSLFIAANELKYNFYVISLHYCFILLAFSTFYISLHYGWLLFFSFLCGLLALCCILLTRLGDKLITFGNFIFIPAVYLACEMYYGLPQVDWRTTYFEFLVITPIAWLTIAILYFFFKDAWYSASSALTRPSELLLEKKYALSLFPYVGVPSNDWIIPSVAIFLSVFFSANLAFFLRLDSPEWLIWSSASVIIVGLKLSRKKFLHRFFGAIMGITIGMCLSPFLPHTEWIYLLALLGSMLTLVSFRDYLISFTSRCVFITIAACALSISNHMAYVRVSNVFIGSFIGLVFIHCTHYLTKWLKPGKKIAQ